MSLKELLRAQLIKKIGPNREQAIRLIKICDRDLKSAKNSLASKDYDWVYAMAYNVMLQSARAVMYAKGFIAAGGEGHIAIINFARDQLKDIDRQKIELLDRMRIKRHSVIYDEPDIITFNQADNAIKIAEDFLSKIKKILKMR